MKTILIIIAALGFQISTLIASNTGDVIVPASPDEFYCAECPILIPKVPLEAPFMEITEFVNPIDLAPLVPMEATFCDDTEIEMIAYSFAPVIPSQADFDEDIYDEIITIYFIDRFRDEKKFKNLDFLRRRLILDKHRTLQIFEEYEKKDKG